MDRAPEFRSALLRAPISAHLPALDSVIILKAPVVFYSAILIEKNREWRGSSFVLKHAATRNKRIAA